jgi:hypothetical protein
MLFTQVVISAKVWSCPFSWEVFHLSFGVHSHCQALPGFTKVPYISLATEPGSLLLTELFRKDAPL